MGGGARWAAAGEMRSEGGRRLARTRAAMAPWTWRLKQLRALPSWVSPMTLICSIVRRSCLETSSIANMWISLKSEKETRWT